MGGEWRCGVGTILFGKSGYANEGDSQVSVTLLGRDGSSIQLGDSLHERFYFDGPMND